MCLPDVDVPDPRQRRIPELSGEASVDGSTQRDLRFGEVSQNVQPLKGRGRERFTSQR